MLLNLFPNLMRAALYTDLQRLRRSRQASIADRARNFSLENVFAAKKDILHIKLKTQLYRIID